MRRRYKRDFNAMANTIARARGFEKQEIVNLTLPNGVDIPTAAEIFCVPVADGWGL